MNVKDIKRMHISELLSKALDLNIENAANLSRQDLVYEILRAQTSLDGEVWGEGVLEVLPDGYGFLRSIDYMFRHHKLNGLRFERGIRFMAEFVHRMMMKSFLR